MKVATVLALSATALAAVHPHRHRHRHPDLELRAPNPVAESNPGPTVVVYVLNGKPIPESEVFQGIKNGTLVWGDGGDLKSAVPSSAPAPSSIYTPTPTPSAVKVAEISKVAEPSSAAPSSAAKAAASSSPKSSSGSTDGVDKEFPSGTLSCGSFPEGYGAVKIDWMGLGGWIGIQQPAYSGANGYNDISTVPHGSCSGGNCCQEGSFCSYACPAGYLKSSWPKLQGVTGQSVGGLQCSGGKLQLADGAIAKSLCVKGTDKVSIQVVNKLSSDSVSICRTDYPGTESETIPTTSWPGQTAELACPDGATYYRWGGKSTSAQYYINNKGVAESDACWWGDGSKPQGNWAPANLGVGYSNGKAYISLFQNAPTTDAKLDFTVELIGDDVNGKCKYQNGQYCSGSSCNSKEGCTVAVNSGTLQVVLSD